MKKILIAAILFISIKADAQNYMLKPGDQFPKIVIGPVINAPVTELNLSKYPSNKLFIINLWGTWCSPCIPEMDSLAKLQSRFSRQIQVIGLSDEPVDRLKKYLAKKPSKIWLASDTASLLYRMLNLAYVGQCIVVNAKHEIVALLKTDSVNAKVINRLIKGEKVKSNGGIQNRLNSTDKDPFGVDSLLASNFTIRSYMADQKAMGKRPNTGIFAGRRVTYYNVGVVNMFKTAYNITSLKQIVYEGSAKKYDNYEDKNLLYCFDLLVKPEQKDSLLIIMQNKLQQNLPVKARIELRDTDVYVLKLKDTAKVLIPKSKLTTITYGFSGRGFDGQGVTLNEFANLYLSNEFDLPVVDESGLKGRYDIKTNVEMRTKAGVMKSIEDLGFLLNKERRKVRVMILYTN
ncbi:MAG: redoxin domain-containing protein [Bacteroidota bacterium]